MDKLFAGPLGILLVIAQAAFFVYLMRGLFETVAEDGINRVFGVKKRPRRKAASEPREPPPRRETSWGGTRGWARTSRTFETFFDPATGAVTGRIVEGPYAGRRLPHRPDAALRALPQR